MRAMVLALIALFALSIPSRDASAQSPERVGHATDSWSHSCSSQSDCDAWYQWHMRCVHVQHRNSGECDRVGPPAGGGGAMAINPFTITATFMALGAAGGALAAVMQDASIDPNGPLDEVKSAPYLTYAANGALFGGGIALVGYGLTKAPKMSGRAWADVISSATGAAVVVAGVNANEQEKPKPEQEADKESGKTQRDQMLGAAGGALFGFGMSEMVRGIVEMAKVNEFAALRRFRDRHPSIQRAKLTTSINPFGATFIGVTIR